MATKIVPKHPSTARPKPPLVRPTLLRGKKPRQRHKQGGNGWAITTRLAEEIYAHCVEHEPKCIVECGSGVSTKYLAQYAQDHDEVKVVSLEHDEKWLSDTRLRFNPKGVDLLHAPLGEDNWFEVDLEAVLEGREVDFVFVDGPPGSTGGRERTLAHLLPHLANGAWVWLHDALRKGEQEILRTWQRDIPGFELVGVDTINDQRGTMKARVWKSPSQS